MKRHAWVSTLIAAGALAMLAGCQSGGEAKTGEGEATGKKFQIAVIPKGATHEFWKAIHAGADEAAAANGAEVIWKGPLKEDDREDQIKVVEDFVAKGVDGIVLAPLDDTALRTPVMAAQKEGIPVLIIDSALKEVETVSFVATDNKAAGKSGGEKLLTMLPNGGKVILLRYQEGSASTSEREAGFLEAMAGATNVTMLSDNQYAGPTTESAQAASEKLIDRFRNPDGTVQFEAVFCPNESSTFGMLRALQNAGLAGKVRFVGFDSSPKLVEALGTGEINALVVQNPFLMGKTGVEMMIKHLKGETVEKRVDSGAKVVDKANMADPEIAKLITPPNK